MLGGLSSSRRAPRHICFHQECCYVLGAAEYRTCESNLQLHPAADAHTTHTQHSAGVAHWSNGTCSPAAVLTPPQQHTAPPPDPLSNQVKHQPINPPPNGSRHALQWTATLMSTLSSWRRLQGPQAWVDKVTPCQHNMCRPTPVAVAVYTSTCTTREHPRQLYSWHMLVGRQGPGALPGVAA